MEGKKRYRPRKGPEKLTVHSLALLWFGRLKISQVENRLTNRGVYNLSSKPLSSAETSVLSLGLKFVPTPPASTFGCLQQELPILFRSVALQEHFKGQDSKLNKFRIRNKNWHPPENPVLQEIFRETEEDFRIMSQQRQVKKVHSLTFDERSALKSLATSTDLVIKPADKNLGITVMDRDFYINQCLAHLLDPRVYSPVCFDPTIQVLGQFERIREEWGPALTSSLWKFFKHPPIGGWKPAAFYCLLKVHKKIPVGRPIAASHSWITANVSCWLDSQLRPLVLRQPTYIRDSLSLLLRLEDTQFPQSILLATYDVTSLYPSIPIKDGINACRYFLERYHHNLTDLIISLLEWVMYNSYVEFDGVVYHQLRGTAMGTSVAVCFAILFMSRLDEELSDTTAVSPLMHVRFIDDGLIVWDGDKDSLMEYLAAFNNLSPTIKLTWTVSDSSIDFLDLTFHKGLRFTEQGVLDLATFQKPMNTYLYLPFSSFHPKHCKQGFIKSELKQYLLRSSDFNAFWLIKQAFFVRLRARGYPRWFLEPLFNSVTLPLRDTLLSTARNKSVMKHHGPVVFKTTYTPLTQGLFVGFLLKRFKSRLISHGFSFFTDKRFILAWTLPKKLCNTLCRSRLRRPPVGLAEFPVSLESSSFS